MEIESYPREWPMRRIPKRPENEMRSWRPFISFNEFKLIMFQFSNLRCLVEGAEDSHWDDRCKSSYWWRIKIENWLIYPKTYFWFPDLDYTAVPTQRRRRFLSTYRRLLQLHSIPCNPYNWRRSYNENFWQFDCIENICQISSPNDYANCTTGNSTIVTVI